MAKVFKRNKATNHFLWPFLADFHKATPFQGKTQSKIKSIKGEPIPIPAFKFKKESNMSGEGGTRTHKPLTGFTLSRRVPYQFGAPLLFSCSNFTTNLGFKQ